MVLPAPKTPSRLIPSPIVVVFVNALYEAGIDVLSGKSITKLEGIVVVEFPLESIKLIGSVKTPTDTPVG